MMEHIGPFEVNSISITQRQRSILWRLVPFYTSKIISTILMPVVLQSSEISLRSLDWLVTNFSKKHNIVCHDYNGTLFNIYHGYKISLTHFRRRNFDPFRRRTRIKIKMLDGEHVETTVGQLNFLHWAHKNGVLEYATAHATAIEKDMNAAASRQKMEKKKQTSGHSKRRRELSKAPKSKCSVYQVDTHISFGLTSDFDK